MRLFFNHLPKNGGVSVHRYLGACLGDLYRDLNANEPFQIMADTTGEDIRKASEGRICVGGHVSYPREEIAQILRKEFISFSVLRDPVSRFISWVNYMKYSRDTDIGPRWKSGDGEFNINDIVNNGSLLGSFNTQSAQLMFDSLTRLYDIYSFEHVWSGLRKNFVFVGVLERMDLFYEALQEVFETAYGGAGSLSLPPPAEAANVSDKRECGLDKRQVDSLLANTALDAALHQRVLSLGVWINRPLLERMRTMEPPV